MEDRWLGGESSKRQEVNNKGCPPKACTPHQKSPSQSLLKLYKETLWWWPRRASFTICAHIPQYSLTTALADTKEGGGVGGTHHMLNSISFSVRNKWVSLIRVGFQSLLLMRKRFSSRHIFYSCLFSLPAAERSEIKKPSARSQEVSYSALVPERKRLPLHRHSCVFAEKQQYGRAHNMHRNTPWHTQELGTSAHTSQCHHTPHISTVKDKIEKGHSWEDGFLINIKLYRLSGEERQWSEAVYRDCRRFTSNQPSDLHGGSLLQKEWWRCLSERIQNTATDWLQVIHQL